MGNLVLLRHGETQANITKLLDTRVPGAPLTEKGIQQAYEWGTTQDPRQYAVLCCSEALRARQTLNALVEGMLAAHPELSEEDLPPRRILPGMHETQVGDWENASIDCDEVRVGWFSHFLGWMTGDHDKASPGLRGESAHMVRQRVLPQIAALREEFLTPDTEGGDVLIVAHGAVIPLTTTFLVPSLDGRFGFWSFLPNVSTVVLAPLPNGDDTSEDTTEAAADVTADAPNTAGENTPEAGRWELLSWAGKTAPFVCEIPKEWDDPAVIARMSFSSMGNKTVTFRDE